MRDAYHEELDSIGDGLVEIIDGPAREGVLDRLASGFGEPLRELPGDEKT